MILEMYKCKQKHIIKTNKNRLMRDILIFFCGMLAGTTIVCLIELYAYYGMRGTLKYFWIDFF